MPEQAAPMPASAPLLRAAGVCVTAAGRRLVSGADLQVHAGELVALLGPNGAGKTTLLRAALGLLPTEKGSALLGGTPAGTLPAAERARKAAYLPQARPMAWPNVVADVVALGRFAHGASMGRLGPEDRAAVSRALDACELRGLADRRADTLSGGEAARMHFARALAADAPLLIADEPVAALDPRHQFKIMDILARFVADGGGALAVLHDVGLAAAYAHRLVLMKDGRIIAEGAPETVLTAELLAETYGVAARLEGGRVLMDGAL